MLVRPWVANGIKGDLNKGDLNPPSCLPRVRALILRVKFPPSFSYVIFEKVVDNTRKYKYIAVERCSRCHWNLLNQGDQIQHEP